MNGRRRPLLSALVTAAAFGAVAGHSATYVVAIPDPATRRVFLTATGHDYWPAAVPAALILGVFAGVSTLIRHLGADRESDPAGGWSWSRTIGVLGLLQCGIFLTQETLERIAVGAPLGTMLQGHLLPIGLLVQLGVAAVVAVVLFVLARTAEIFAAALARGVARGRVARSFGPRALALHARLDPSSSAIRAPPSTASSPVI